ncbi:MAG: hypothetical protein ACFFDN_05310, partial [Candidatus Hodarchaeota archaeon]
NSLFLSKFLLSLFQLAFLSRIDILESQRIPFYIYADELHRAFYQESIKEFFERFRKYKGCLIVSIQHPGQLANDVYDDILHNCKTFLVFETGSKEAKKISQDFITEIDCETENVDFTEFLKLETGDCYCKIGKHSFPMKINPIDERINEEYINKIITASRNNYGVQAQAVKELIDIDELSLNDPFLMSDPKKVFSEN